jgi:excisionase family DNA binding protein
MMLTHRPWEREAQASGEVVDAPAWRNGSNGPVGEVVRSCGEVGQAAVAVKPTSVGLDYIQDVPDELMTVKEVAELLKLNQQTIRNMIDRGELGNVRVGPRRIRIRQSQLDAFLAAGESRPESADTNPWQAVSEAALAVSAAAREQDRDALKRAIRSLRDAARGDPLGGGHSHLIAHPVVNGP